MRALVQRVSHATVRVGGESVASIGPGLLVLLGVARADTEEVARRLAAKILSLRIFADAAGRMSEPVGDREILCVSQLTLLADTRAGNRPSFADAADPQRAEALYELACGALHAQRGRFAAHMQVDLTNDGPVTILVEVT